MDKKLIQLNDALALLIPFPQLALTFLQQASVNYTLIDFGGGSLAMWNSILHYAENTEKVKQLVQVILEKYPDNPYLLAFMEETLQDYNPGPDIKSITWKTRLDDETKEKLMGSESTLLPIKFLAEGLRAARAVARIKISGPAGDELGSGFLVANNILVTNNHVIADIEAAKTAEVAFNYEESVSGNAMLPKFCKLAPDAFFKTSQQEDWTLVEVAEPVNELFGELKLNPDVKKGDFVNIIQHPGGRYKQIALYHNIVTYKNDDIVQYLTDTEPGSSGSPVFNSKWEVVALHHSGGVLVEPGLQQKMLRNEGIAIEKVIQGLK